MLAALLVVFFRLVVMVALTALAVIAPMIGTMLFAMFLVVLFVMIRARRLRRGRIGDGGAGGAGLHRRGLGRLHIRHLIVIFAVRRTVAAMLAIPSTAAVTPA